MFLEIMSPEKTLFKGEILSLSVPGVEGNFQILKNHAPIVSLLQSGKINITADKFEFNSELITELVRINEQEYSLNIDFGTLEMKDNKIIILID